MFIIDASIRITQGCASKLVGRMDDGQKPPLDWSLVKAYVAGVFTVTIFNRYMFLGGLIGVFTGIMAEKDSIIFVTSHRNLCAATISDKYS